MAGPRCIRLRHCAGLVMRRSAVPRVARPPLARRVALHRTAGVVARQRLLVCRLQPPTISNAICQRLFMRLHYSGAAASLGVISTDLDGTTNHSGASHGVVIFDQRLRTAGFDGVDGSVALIIHIY